MRKITEIPVTKTRTRYLRDGQGNEVRIKESYTVYKKVPTISDKERIKHYFDDGMLMSIFHILLMFGFMAIVVKADFNSYSWIIFMAISFFIVSMLFGGMYYVFFEYRYQQTPGKKSTNSIVVDEYGTRPSLQMIIIRTLIRMIPFEPYSCFGDPSWGWHDEWSGTFVINRDVLKHLLNEIERLEDKL